MKIYVLTAIAALALPFMAIEPDNNGRATDDNAGTDEGNADYCAGESEEDAPRAGAGVDSTTGEA